MPFKAVFFFLDYFLRKDRDCVQSKKPKMIAIDCCYMCKKSGETMDHLLLHCEIAWAALWNDLVSKFGHMLGKMVDLLTCW